MPIPTKEDIIEYGKGKSIHVDFPAENGVKQKRTPRNYHSILKGALALDLPDRVQLKKELAASIEDTVARAKKVAEEAIKIAQE